MAFELIEAGHAPLRGRTATVARSAFARMEQLVEDALAMTRAAAMTPPLQRTRFMLLPLLDEIGDMACGCDVRVRVDADPELEIDADRRLLTSAVSNLVQNAVKFTRAGGQVSLRAREEGIVVAIEVEDECGGLPAGTADDLFRPFVQRSADRSGVGLGLAIVRESIEAHGGHVHVHNLPGKGCVFKVELPALSTRTLPSFVASMSSP
jgi:signal transduction histidine kinase